MLPICNHCLTPVRFGVPHKCNSTAKATAPFQRGGTAQPKKEEQDTWVIGYYDKFTFVYVAGFDNRTLKLSPEFRQGVLDCTLAAISLHCKHKLCILHDSEAEYFKS